MKKQLLCILQVLFLSTLYAAPGPKKPNGLIKKSVNAFMSENAIPGVAVALFYGGKQWFYNFGYADPLTGKRVTVDTIFEIGSITKTLTSTLFSQEIEREAVKLTGHLDEYIPFLKDNPCALSAITLEQLATHTSSLPGWTTVPNAQITEQAVLESLLSWTPSFTPGTARSYSNIGYVILGYALEHATGNSYIDLLNQEISLPLGMGTTFIDVPPYLESYYAQGFNSAGIPVPPFPRKSSSSGALRSTSHDMMRYLMANLGVFGPQELKDAMQWAHQEFFPISSSAFQALGWRGRYYNGNLIMGKSGGTFGMASWIGFHADSKIGLVLLMNKKIKGQAAFGANLILKLMSMV